MWGWPELSGMRPSLSPIASSLWPRDTAPHPGWRPLSGPCWSWSESGARGFYLPCSPPQSVRPILTILCGGAKQGYSAEPWPRPRDPDVEVERWAGQQAIAKAVRGLSRTCCPVPWESAQIG